MNEYLTEAELAEHLKISRQLLWVLRREGLPFRKVGGVIRYVPEEVDAWLVLHCQGNNGSNDPKKEK